LFLLGVLGREKEKEARSKESMERFKRDLAAGDSPAGTDQKAREMAAKMAELEASLATERDSDEEEVPAMGGGGFKDADERLEYEELLRAHGPAAGLKKP